MKAENIRDLASLLNLSMGSYMPRQLDKSETKRINKEHGAIGTPLKVNRDRLSGTRCGEILSDITKAQSECRALFRSRTLTWDDSGRRMATNDKALDLMEEMRRRSDVIDGLVQKFVDAWPSALEEAKKALNGGWKPEYEADYMIPAEEIRQKFKFSIGVESIPNSNDIRIKCPDDTMQKLIAQAEQDVMDKFEKGCREAVERMQQIMEKIYERASIAHGKDGTRDTIGAHIQNLSDLLDIFPMLNIAKNPQLDKFAAEAKKRILSFDLPAEFANETASVEAITNRLKDDKLQRANAAKAANDILRDIKQYLGGSQ